MSEGEEDKEVEQHDSLHKDVPKAMDFTNTAGIKFNHGTVRPKPGALPTFSGTGL